MKKKKLEIPKPRNPIAKDLRSPKYRIRSEKNKKGKGSYNRRDNRSGDYFFVKNLMSVLSPLQTKCEWRT